jgi:glycosyltransferase involved in cell wall biosynthesis
LKVAIVCDWLTGLGGAERVVLELHNLFPDAPIYTSQYDPSQIDWFKAADVRTGWLQKLPKRLRKFLPPLRALFFSRLDLRGYDLVISSSGAEAKGVKTSPGATHICYMHSPTHYYWIRYDEYLRSPGFGRLDWLARLGLKALVGPMRRWDYRAAQRPDHIIANSTHTRAMIQQFYDREATVIHPPVDIARFAAKVDAHRHGFVTAGRQVPYKRIDLAVKAFDQIDAPLLVLGNGPDHKYLRRLAGRKVTFIAKPSDEEVAHYFKTSLAFIFPGLEDFGIAAVEALAAGTPVIAFKGGGALDYIEPGKNGLFFDRQEVDSLVKAVNSFTPEKFDEAAIRQSSVKFSAEAFRQNMRQYVAKLERKN